MPRRHLHHTLRNFFLPPAPLVVPIVKTGQLTSPTSSGRPRLLRARGLIYKMTGTRWALSTLRRASGTERARSKPGKEVTHRAAERPPTGTSPGAVGTLTWRQTETFTRRVLVTSTWRLTPWCSDPEIPGPVQAAMGNGAGTTWSDGSRRRPSNSGREKTQATAAALAARIAAMPRWPSPRRRSCSGLLPAAAWRKRWSWRARPRCACPAPRTIGKGWRHSPSGASRASRVDDHLGAGRRDPVLRSRRVHRHQLLGGRGDRPLASVPRRPHGDREPSLSWRFHHRARRGRAHAAASARGAALRAQRSAPLRGGGARSRHRTLPG